MFEVILIENDNETKFEKTYSSFENGLLPIEIYSNKPDLKEPLKCVKNDYISYSNIIDKIQPEVKFEIQIDKILKCNLVIDFGETEINITATTDIEQKKEKLKVKV